MTKRGSLHPDDVQLALNPVTDWIAGTVEEEPTRALIAHAVRVTARFLALCVPGNSVEVRIAPHVAVQCVEGHRHTRGNPPHVYETDSRTWLQMAIGLLDPDTAYTSGAVTASGHKAREIEKWFPLLDLGNSPLDTSEHGTSEVT